MLLHKWLDIPGDPRQHCRCEVCGQTTHACSALCPGVRTGLHPLELAAQDAIESGHEVESLPSDPAMNEAMDQIWKGLKL